MEDEQSLLKNTLLYKGVYLVGVFVNGVTVYKQQVRALNLVWALSQTKKFNPEKSKIAVIGGGIAGLTVASAFLAKGLKNLHLFERRAMLCPLQQGCDIRWLHPHIYDWPSHGSNRRVAGLPLMNWEEGRASDVAYELTNEWSNQVRKARQQGAKVTQTLSATHLALTTQNQIEWVGITNGQAEGNSQFYDYVIIAVGFGEESGSNSYEAISYWRNEDLGQQHLNADRKRAILISGTGDGGLIDLLRVRLTQFRQDTIIGELFPKSDPSLIARLQQLKKDYPTISKGEHMNSLKSALGNSEDALTQRIRQRLRDDTIAVLHIRAKSKSPSMISSIFGVNASFLNNVLVYLLYVAGGFTPVCANEVENVPDIASFDQVFIRHGTNRRKVIEQLLADPISKYISNRIDELEKNQKEPVITILEQHIQQSYPPLWPAGWFDNNYSEKKDVWRQEYAPSATVALCTAFVAGLASCFPEDVKYRATFHRSIYSAGEWSLQQVAHYQGSRSTKGIPYRAFKVDRTTGGFIGLSFRTRAAWATKPELTDNAKTMLHEDMKLLNLSEAGAQTMDDEVVALLTIPLLSNARNSAPIGVLFIDSTTQDVFTDERCACIASSLQGFALMLDRVEVDFNEVTRLSENDKEFFSWRRVDLKLPNTKLKTLDLDWTRKSDLVGGNHASDRI
jgi:hypothetical protein